MKRPKYAGKVPVDLIVRLYKSHSLGVRDEELLSTVGWKLHKRCLDVLLVSDSMVVCPECQARFQVPWIGQPPERVTNCPLCGWSITSADYHASWRHQDLRGSNARSAFAEFALSFPRAGSYAERLLLIDRLVHAVHKTGGVAARNLFEGRPREVISTLDRLASE